MYNLCEPQFGPDILLRGSIVIKQDWILLGVYMKIVVFADSHGDKETMKLFIEKLGPETVIFLGDGAEDILALENEYPELRFEYVKGNCDTIESVPTEKLISLDGFNFYLSHSDMYDYRFDTDKIVKCAREKGASLFLHGHTHTPTLWSDNEITIMNPGTVRNKPGMGCATCGLIYTYESRFICKILFAAFISFYIDDIISANAIRLEMETGDGACRS